MTVSFNTTQLVELIRIRYAKEFNKSFVWNNLDIEKSFHEELVMVFQDPKQFCPKQFSTYPLPTILKYLEMTHRFYLDKKVNEIEQTIDRLTYNEDYGEYWQPILKSLFSNYHKELVEHIQEEEEHLFPYIKALLKSRPTNPIDFCFERKIRLINHLLNHNDDAEQKLRGIIDLLESKESHFEDWFVLKVLLTKLKLFELDLMIHARLEDDVLLPMALQLEEEVLKTTDYN